jgi:pimeloyl-ACP methyl ester carboxylesterase
MQTVTSKDGTSIAFDISGAGPPLVLVHGTTADHNRWAPVLAALEKHFTVYAIDRRGRGASGDNEPYALEREFEDVAAVVDSIGRPTFLLGHSYGALISLEAALRTTHLAALVLYEPPIPTGAAPLVSPDEIARLEAVLARGDRGAVVSMFFREVAKLPASQLELLQRRPNWPARVAAAHTIPREERASSNYRFDGARFGKLAVPVLLVQGGDSPAFLRDAIRAVHSAIPAAELVVLPGQQHVAIDSAPSLFTDAVVKFLAG